MSVLARLTVSRVVTTGVPVVNRLVRRQIRHVSAHNVQYATSEYQGGF